MKNIEINFQVQVHTELAELLPEDQNLIKEAKKAALKAYSPYSGFSVGAAVLLDNNEIISGSNQENAAYPSGLCAERVAMFYANAQYPDTKTNTIAICAKNKNGFISDPVPPCGACRQVLIETAERFKNNIKVILYGQSKIYVIDDVKKLLPIYFIDKNLE